MLALLTNRYVLTGIAIAAIAISIAVWWERTKSGWIETGAESARVSQKAANEKARADRQAAIAGFVVDFSKREGDLRDELKRKEYEIEKARSERKPNVTPVADSRCIVPRGFLYDHDADLSRAAGGPAVPAPPADVNGDSGVPLSRVSREVGHNYGELGKCIARLSVCEERRYSACVEWDRKFGTKSNCTR